MDTDKISLFQQFIQCFTFFGAVFTETCITDETKAAMKQVLAEIQDGTFAKNWILENQANRPAFNAMRRKGAEHPIEEVGKNLRGMMSWMKK